MMFNLLELSSCHVSGLLSFSAGARSRALDAGVVFWGAWRPRILFGLVGRCTCCIIYCWVWMGMVEFESRQKQFTIVDPVDPLFLKRTDVFYRCTFW